MLVSAGPRRLRGAEEIPTRVGLVQGARVRVSRRRVIGASRRCWRGCRRVCRRRRGRRAAWFGRRRGSRSGRGLRGRWSRFRDFRSGRLGLCRRRRWRSRFERSRRICRGLRPDRAFPGEKQGRNEDEMTHLWLSDGQDRKDSRERWNRGLRGALLLSARLPSFRWPNVGNCRPASDHQNATTIPPVPSLRAVRPRAGFACRAAQSKASEARLRRAQRVGRGGVRAAASHAPDKIVELNGIEPSASSMPFRRVLDDINSLRQSIVTAIGETSADSNGCGNEISPTRVQRKVHRPTAR